MSGIKEVAKAAGVSIATVSNVLNDRKYVSPELKTRVLKAVKDLAYEADPIAKRMKSQDSGVIGVITADMYGVFYSYVLRGINEVAQKMGYQVMLSDAKAATDSQSVETFEMNLIREFVQSRVDGIIFVSAVSNAHKEKYLNKLKKELNRYKPTPIVSMERNFTEFGIDSVYYDFYNNARIAVRHLIDNGCKHIAMINGPKTAALTEERYQGFLDEVQSAGLHVDIERMVQNGNYSHQSGYMAMKMLLDNCKEIDGVFCANDQMAVGALKVLRDYQIRVPEEIKLIGYDDIFISSIVEPSLSTIHIQKKHTGLKAAEILFDRIENKLDPKEVKGVQMDGRLVVRRSTVPTAPEDWILTDW